MPEDDWDDFSLSRVYSLSVCMNGMVFSANRKRNLMNTTGHVPGLTGGHSAPTVAEDSGYAPSGATFTASLRDHLRWGQLPSARRVEVHRLPHLRIEIWTAARSW